MCCMRGGGRYHLFANKGLTTESLSQFSGVSFTNEQKEGMWARYGLSPTTPPPGLTKPLISVWFFLHMPPLSYVVVPFSIKVVHFHSRVSSSARVCAKCLMLLRRPLRHGAPSPLQQLSLCHLAEGGGGDSYAGGVAAHV